MFDDTEPNIEVPVERDVAVPGRGATKIVIVDERAAAQHTVVMAFDFFTAISGRVRFFPILSGAPLPYIAAHILGTAYGRTLWESTDSRCAIQAYFT